MHITELIASSKRVGVSLSPFQTGNGSSGVGKALLWGPQGGVSWLLYLVPPDPVFPQPHPGHDGLVPALHPNLLVLLTLGPAWPVHPGDGRGEGGDEQHGIRSLYQGAGRGQSTQLPLPRRLPMSPLACPHWPGLSQQQGKHPASPSFLAEGDS